jgi:hypothetical protein
MMKVFAVVSATVLLSAGGVLASPDPSGPAKYGLCTAYFSGQGGEHGNRNDAPPFQALAQAAEDQDQSVADFCRGTRPGNRGDADRSSAPDPVDR